MDNNNSVPHGIVCTPAQYERSLTDSSIYCLTRSESIGLTAVSYAGLLSLFAVSCVFIIILRNLTWRIRHIPRKELQVFDGTMDWLMFSLFSADVLQAIGAVMVVKWIHDGKVEVGEFCTAQGIVKQVGNTGVAMTTLMIAVYTFLGGWLKMDVNLIPRRVTQGILIAIWLFIALFVTLANLINRGKGKSPFQSPTPYWCWISEEYFYWRIFAEYIWYWLTLGFSCLVYIPLYFWSRGNLIFDEHTWWKFSLQRAKLNADPELKVIRRRSLVMLLYPVVYCISILPMSIVRWMDFTHERVHGVSHISPSATFAVGAIYALSGTCNVALFLTTRPESVLFGKTIRSRLGRAPSLRNLPEEQSLHILEQNEDGEDIGRLPSR